MKRFDAAHMLLVAVICLGAAGFAVLQWSEWKESERQNARVHDLELERQVTAGKLDELQKKVDGAAAAEKALREEVARQDLLLRQQREAANTPQHPDPGKPTCFDSDARLGADAIYVQGYVDVSSGLGGGSGRSTDQCRLDQLVEFYCIENPPGSGRFLPDAKFVNCPSGSRCVSGECLRPVKP